MTVPLVDIGITVHDRADYVARAIQSVVEQSYTHWRLTISQDGGMTTPVKYAVEPYLEDERVSYVTPGEHLGIARHKSSLVARGHGKYAALLDDDDVWLSGWLARRVDFLEKHPSCVLVWAGNIEIDAAGEKVRQSVFPLGEGVHSSLDFMTAETRHNIVGSPSVLFRRAPYIDAGGEFDSRFVVINDYELWLRLGLLGPVGFLAVHDSGYRLHPEQRTRRHDRALDHLQLVDHLDCLLQASLPALRLSPRERRRQTADWLLSAALDAAEADQARIAARRIASAARRAPQALVSQRGIAAIAATAGGKAVRRRVVAARS